MDDKKPTQPPPATPTKKRGGGRPSKFTPEVRRRILDSLALGVHYDVAIGYAGIDYSTFAKWMQRGKHECSGEFFEFYTAVKNAVYRAEIRVVATWQKHTEKDPRACRDFLARRHPDRWSDSHRVRVRVRKELLAAFQRLKKQLPQATYEQVVDIMAAEADDEEISNDGCNKI
jgi:hypothetical protein